MSAATTEWDLTFNPWWGCDLVSSGCQFCYAEGWARRWGQNVWGPSAPRRVSTDAYWQQPLRWNRAAEQTGTPLRVCCGSMCDVFEDHADPAVTRTLNRARVRLWELIEQTPWLHWQLPTKRPEHVTSMVPWADEDWPCHVWLGTLANQRVPILASIPAHVRFVVCEPLLGPLDLSRWLGTWGSCPRTSWHTATGTTTGHTFDCCTNPVITWVITGGESGVRARPLHPNWVRSLRDQCVAARVPYLHKQWGQFLPTNPVYEPSETPDAWDETNLELTGTGCAVNPDGTQPVQWGCRGYRIESRPQLGAWWLLKVGTRSAGRDLDGHTWHQLPTHAQPHRALQH